MVMMIIGGDSNMSDEFIMYVFVPMLMIVLGYIFYPSIEDKYR